MEEEKDPIHFSPEAKQDLEEIIAEDPQAAESFREIFANIRQAMHAVKSGQYADFGEAMEAITGSRPQRIDTDEDED